MKKLSIALTGLFMATPAAALALTQACNTPECGQGGARTISSYITTITTWVLGIAAFIAVLIIIWGGIQYVLAAGNTDRAKNARQTILYAVVGLIIIVLAYFIVSFVINFSNDFLIGGNATF